MNNRLLLCIPVLTMFACRTVSIVEPSDTQHASPPSLTLKLHRVGDPKTFSAHLDQQDISHLFSSIQPGGKVTVDPGDYCGGVSASEKPTVRVSAQFQDDKPLLKFLRSRTSDEQTYSSPRLVVAEEHHGTGSIRLQIKFGSTPEATTLTVAPLDDLIAVDSSPFGVPVSLDVPAGTTTKQLNMRVATISQAVTSGAFVTMPCYVRLKYEVDLEP